MAEAKIGDVVTFVTAERKELPALVTAVFPGAPYGRPDMVNVVFTSEDPNRQDSYGRQVERATSVPHLSLNQAGGMAWKERTL